MKAGLKASGKVVDVLFSPLCVMPDRLHAGTENISSFSLFQRSIAEGKEGEEGRGGEGDYKVIYQVNQSWPPAAMADISIEAWKLI